MTHDTAKPFRLGFLTPVHGSGGRGARNRPSPAVDAAYGMPRQTRRSPLPPAPFPPAPPTATPPTTPPVVRTSRSLTVPP